MSQILSQESKHLVVIAGLPASGKSLLGGIVELLDICWIPIQDSAFHTEFDRALGSDKMLEGIVSSVRSLSHEGCTWDAVSFSGSTFTHALFDYSKFEKIYSSGSAGTKKSDFVENWFWVRECANAALLYKRPAFHTHTHVIMPGAAHRYVEKYSQLGIKTSFIWIDRAFHSWINSRVASEQRYYKMFDPKKDRSNKKPRNVWKFALKTYDPNFYVQEFLEYDNHLKKWGKMVVSFEDLFHPRTQGTLDRIADFLNRPRRKLDPENDKIDLFGNLNSFERALTPFDDKRRFISSLTQSFYGFGLKRGRVGRLSKLFLKALFIWDFYFSSGWKKN